MTKTDFPTDPATLRLLLDRSFTISQVLDFLSGYQEGNSLHVEGDVWEYPGVVFSHDDAIRALAGELLKVKEGK